MESVEPQGGSPRNSFARGGAIRPLATTGADVPAWLSPGAYRLADVHNRAERAEAMLRGANDDWRAVVTERNQLAETVAKVRELVDGMSGLLPEAIRAILDEGGCSDDAH